MSPGYRGRGIGRALTAALVEAGRRRGCGYAWLGTDRGNAAAQACFRSVPDGEPPQQFLLFEWQLED